MVIEIPEKILVYNQQDFEAWTQGDKSLIPSFLPVPDAVANQPQYHFPEILTLRHYHQSHGWLGFHLYALGPQYPGSESRKLGRAFVERIIPADDLQRFRQLQAADPLIRSGAGEPDLFLYNEKGAFMFVEVKKGPDRIRAPQLRCIALILAILRCPVDIVHLREERQSYRPKSHKVDLRTL
jgi:hypothetical protein